MTDQDRTRTEATGQAPGPLPVTPSVETEKPEGLAFDVAKDADLSGVPAGDQAAKNAEAGHTAEAVREMGGGVGLAVPGDRATPDDDNTRR